MLTSCFCSFSSCSLHHRLLAVEVSHLQAVPLLLYRPPSPIMRHPPWVCRVLYEVNECSLRPQARDSLLSSCGGNAAMCLAIFPRPPMRRPTSAALSVLNLRTTPDSGSYVFNVSVARGARGAAAASLSSASTASLFLFFGCAYFGESRFGMLYFVVIRV